MDIDVTDFSEKDIANTLINISDSNAQKAIRDMFVKLRLQKNPEFAFIEVYDDTSFKFNARVVREVVELLQPYQFRYGHKQQFLGDFFELLLNTSIKQEAGQYFTPVPITRYIVSSLPIKEMIEKKLKANEAEMLPSVIDFACGTGHFLTEYMDKVQSIIENEIDVSKAKPIARKKLQGWIDYDKFGWAGDYVYGIDADYRLVKSSKVSSFLNGDGEANIIRANGLYYFSKKKYKSNEEKNEFFNSFIYRVVLFDDYIYIFYNTSPEYPTKVKLEKDELQALYTLRDNTAVTTDCGKDKKPEMHPVEKDLGNKKSTLFEPIKFKLGACGGAYASLIELLIEF